MVLSDIDKGFIGAQGVPGVAGKAFCHLNRSAQQIVISHTLIGDPEFYGLLTANRSAGEHHLFGFHHANASWQPLTHAPSWRHAPLAVGIGKLRRFPGDHQITSQRQLQRPGVTMPLNGRNNRLRQALNRLERFCLKVCRRRLLPRLNGF